ncbi:YheC/YheD family protein [Brevibacillus ginsengisoli]|uniref:YheC/YheD family endospore coat-associated protein n=1 Tax=Brevibacillus ginsengisoli TaxID=363854 RepID=UPI003CF636FA
MAQIRSGWLTILPSGRWYLQGVNKAIITGLNKQKRLLAKLGPDSIQKPIQLGAPPQQPHRVRTKVYWAVSNDQLTIGPIVGIMTVGDGSSFRGNRDNFKDIIHSGKRLGALVYVFTPSGINWEKKRIQAFLYNEEYDSWVESVMPFPHVVYNRVPTRKLETKDEVKQTLNQLAKLENVTLFNRHFFNKRTLFQILEKKPEIQEYLPDTKVLSTYAQFQAFAKQHPFIYLKPTRGKAGKGIMRVEQRKSGWKLRCVNEQNSTTRHFHKLADLWRNVILRTRGNRYIIQQGIQLAHYKKRPFDVRVLIQKGGSGEWGVTGIGIRRAGANSITTHVPRGGSILPTTKVLQALFKEQADEIYQHIEQTALSIARLLNEEIEDLAEMSMDLGLTEEGKLWFFEANAKPEKFDEPTIRRSSLANLIYYSQYVSAFMA